MIDQIQYVSDCAIEEDVAELEWPSSQVGLQDDHPTSAFMLVDEMVSSVGVSASLQSDEQEEEGQSLRAVAAKRPNVVLVEGGDEEFARLATDFSTGGMNVLRARTASEALCLCGACLPGLVVANLALQDQSGWLLAAKLRFVDPNVPIWLYQPHSSRRDQSMAKMLQVEELLDYRGDLGSLSNMIIQLLQNRDPESGAETDGHSVPAELGAFLAPLSPGV